MKLGTTFPSTGQCLVNRPPPTMDKTCGGSDIEVQRGVKASVGQYVPSPLQIAAGHLPVCARGAHSAGVGQCGLIPTGASPRRDPIVYTHMI